MSCIIISPRFFLFRHFSGVRARKQLSGCSRRCRAREEESAVCDEKSGAFVDERRNREREREDEKKTREKERREPLRECREQLREESRSGVCVSVSRKTAKEMFSVVRTKKRATTGGLPSSLLLSFNPAAFLCSFQPAYPPPV